MTLDEAIKRAEDDAKQAEEHARYIRYMGRYGWEKECNEYNNLAKSHLQISEWLKDYKRLLEQTDVSNTNVFDLISREVAKSKAVYSHERHEKVVPVAELDWLPSVEPERKTGHWIPRNSFLVPYRCSECNYESERYDNFCPNCGANMWEVDK